MYNASQRILVARELARSGWNVPAAQKGRSEEREVRSEERERRSEESAVLSSHFSLLTPLGPSVAKHLLASRPGPIIGEQTPPFGEQMPPFGEQTPLFGERNRSFCLIREQKPPNRERTVPIGAQKRSIPGHFAIF